MVSPAPSRRRWFWYFLIALIFGTATWYFGFRSNPSARRRSSSSFRSGSLPVPVRAVPTERRDLAVHLKAIGTVVPLNTVIVRSRVDGQLLRVAFEEGQLVKKGQLLAEIDPETYKIRLAQMEAQLRQNAANLQTAKSDLERFRHLFAQTLVSQQQLEQQESLVAQREGALAADQAQIDNARLQLAYTKVEAPIAGRLGMRKVDVGNMVRANDATGLVVITQTQPIAVMFTVPEIDLAKVVEPLRAGEHMAVEAWDRTEQARLAIGTLTTVDNQIDLATGTLRLKAEFPNDDEKLFPNQFVNVQLKVRTLKDALVIPAAAVQYGSRGTYVFIVDEKSQASVRDIVVGPADGPWQSIVKGLQPGEKVVLEGLDRLREGRAVTLVGDEPAPKPPVKPAAGEPGQKGKGGRSKT
ncbi:MAG: MdtA/MuxA family multidrug efflux RND transporter periplasmic adaptor subunit [Opitutaceae bacterium]|nr:MdtA/MuxA family multidrug efflux RND transporter periplasmic adaptor subunit [Opitutaceae bacterium]